MSVMEYPSGSTIHGNVSAQVRRTPAGIVAVFGDHELTYAELESRSNRLAQTLVAQGVQSGDLVGVCLERSLDVPVVLMGILKAGAGYVPLDPDYPADRLRYMCGDANLRLVLAHRSLAALTDTLSAPVVDLEDVSDTIAQQVDNDPRVPIDPDCCVAYVIYTSGSTGKPKGVQVPHRAVVSLMYGMQQAPGIAADDVFIALTTLSFDISVLEIFWPMFFGARIAIIDRGTAKDGGLLIEAVRQHGVTIMQATPSTWRFVLEAGWEGDSGRLKCLTGGEPLPRDLIRPLMSRCAELWNLYGPTETTVYCTGGLVTDPEARILAGHPLGNTTLYVVDENDQLLGPEQEGELLIGGDLVSLGYLNRPELTAEKYVDFRGERVYRSGDLTNLTLDGQVECVGRIDTQIKLHGYRIELGEIDTVLAEFPSVRRAATTDREDRPGDKRLVAYLIPRDEQGLDITAIREFAAARLPAYMVPALFVAVDAFPMTPSGKLDRKALPKPPTERPQASTEYVPPASELEASLAEIMADVLGLDRVGVLDNFFELGGNSILALQATARIDDGLGIQISAPEFFDEPSIRGLLARFGRQPGDVPLLRTWCGVSEKCDVAIVGMAARFPGASNAREFWSNLCNGVESIRSFSVDELDVTLPESLTSDTDYVAARGILEDADKFDAGFFGVGPREAELIDPQQRIMLEVAWTALEDAGCIPESFDGHIGVWAGTYANTYYTNNLRTHPEILERTGDFQLGVHNEKDYIATRVAHKLNLTGPAINVNTACSTSLVAVIMACNSLQLGHCDAAVAGGASVTFPQYSGHLFQEGSIMSPDGHCRPFDEQAAGTLFSDGAGAVVLKRLDDAVRDGDHIYAVIKGKGINNDGGSKASFSAPSIDGQVGAIAMAHAEAGVPVETIGYVEAHGTATPIGDPIEVAALRRVFESQSDAKKFCGLGSVKSNVGHTVAAAGVAGLIKASLALHHGRIPATLHFRNPNPQIAFEESPFFVCDRLTPWERSDTPRRAGVSSFGVGGTNAHLVLEEAPDSVAPPGASCVSVSAPSEFPVELFPISAKCWEALDTNVANIAGCIAKESSARDVAWTLQQGRAAFGYRAIVAATSLDDAATRFLSPESADSFRGQALAGGRQLAFMFPGQGAQYVNMGRDLCDHSVVFREAMDACLSALTPHMNHNLRDILFMSNGQDEWDGQAKKTEQEEALSSTELTQPAMFAVSYALGRMWMELGFRPSALLGHSIGELAAACLAGVFTLDDATKLIARRGQLMSQLPTGTMLSVRLPADDIEKRVANFSEQLVVAAYNGPSLCVVSGPHEEVAELRRELAADKIVCRKLHTSHACHSPMMDSMVPPFAELVTGCQLSPPAIPIMSTVTAEWLTAEQATDPLYWANHVRQPVRFSQAISRLWQEQPRLALVEMGPRKTLTTLAKQHITDRESQVAVPALADHAAHFAECEATAAAIGQLWISGVDVSWRRLHGVVRPRKLSLPTCAFQRARYFIEAAEGPSENDDVASMRADATDVPTDVSSAHQPSNPVPSSMPSEFLDMTNSRQDQIRTKTVEVLEAASGMDVSKAGAVTTFFELGLDSLMLTQTANALKKEFGVSITFRQMLEETPSVEALVDFLDRQVPADQFVDEPAAAVAAPNMVPDNVADVAERSTMTPGLQPVGIDLVPMNCAPSIIQQQLQIMQQQLQVLDGRVAATDAVPIAAHAAQGAAETASANFKTANSRTEPQALASGTTYPGSNRRPPDASAYGSGLEIRSRVAGTAEAASLALTTDSEEESKQVFGAGARVKLGADRLSVAQQQALDEFIRNYNARTAGSKSNAQKHRRYLADPRTVSGFRPALKEMTYPIVVTHSKGALMWDIDGNEWIDVSGGFGSNLFGHTSDFIVQAISEQARTGYEIGPQSPLAGEVARLFTELTGLERMCFSNTGSEAVLGATRLARTVTARDKIVMFHNDYHGILDEVIVRGNKTGRSFPAATGIPEEHVSQVMMLEYGAEESLRIMEENLNDLAAIVVEPVQGRFPERQPKEFLQKLSAMTRNVETALIVDEVITGFRIAPGGAQQYFGFEADLATYGKVVGGGMPIGVIAGKARYMDGLDGGFWKFGDDSQPEAGMTYFAGTFVRHPITLTAAKATLEFIQREGQPIYDQLNAMAADLADGVNEVFRRRGLPARLEHFGSLFKIQFQEEFAWGEMLFAALRHRGIHILDHRPCSLTLSHTVEHVDRIVVAFDESVQECQKHEFLPCCGDASRTDDVVTGRTLPANARQGKDRDGKPAWFVPDVGNPGQFVELNVPV